MSQQPLHENEFPVVTDPEQANPDMAQTSRFFRVSLRTTIMFWFLAISLIPLAFISLVGYRSAVNSRVEDYSTQLTTASQLARQDLKNNFKDLENGMMRQAWNPQTLAMLDELQENPLLGEPSWEGGRQLKTFQVESGVRDILLTDEHGEVLFSCESGQNCGINLLQSEVVDPSLKTKIRTALDTGTTAFASFKQRMNKSNIPLAYQVEPVRGNDGSVRGLLMMELGVELFNKGWERQYLAGAENLFYVVNEDLQLLVASPQFTENQMMEMPLSHQEIRHWQHNLQFADKSLNSEKKFHEVKEYLGLNGEEVLGVIHDLNVLDTTFALVSELPRMGVLAGLKRMGLSLLLVIVLVAILVVLAGLVVAQRMVHPINQLGQVMQRVADGHEVWNLPEKGPREICQLTQMFHCMINKLTDAQKVNEQQYAQKRSQFELNEKLRGESTVEALSEAVLQYLGEYFGAQLGVFYLIESRDTYRVSAQYGLQESSKKLDDVHLGQGVVGCVVAQKRIQVLRGFKEERLKVDTGLVRSYVNHLVVAPLHFGDRVLAILELGLMEDVGQEKLEFLDMVSETVAVAINSARSRERVHRLLKETWSQAAILSKQQKDLRESNRRFELADQYKSEFLANMSHELRTPLNSLLIMSQVLAENRHDNLSREEVDSAMTINRAGSDLLLLINDILDLSRVEAGKLEIQFSEFTLKSLLNDMTDLFVPLAEKQGLEFRTIMGPQLPDFMVSDPLRLTQILKNVLNNAFKFTEQGSVTFRVRVPAPGELAGLDLQGDSSWLVFSVADTGVGMSNETAQHIFEAFNQGDGSIGRRYGGSGLGLSISKQLCEMLGGQIQVESIEGKGSTFRLFLAVEPSEKLLETALQEMPHLDSKVSGDVRLNLEYTPDQKTSKKDQATDVNLPEADLPLSLEMCRVLICEDDMRTVFQISEVLDELGADVTLAPSWAQGVAEGGGDHGFNFAIVSNRLADRPDSHSISAWKEECGNPPYPVLVLVSEEDEQLCDGADLVGRRPLIRGQFQGLIEEALVKEKTQFQH